MHINLFCVKERRKNERSAELDKELCLGLTYMFFNEKMEEIL